jgi:hypothetical protein
LFRGSTPINLKFVSYSDPNAGADAWASLVKRRYPGIDAGLKAQDPAATIVAIGKSPWGTSGATVRNVWNSIPGTFQLGDYTNISGAKGDSIAPEPGQLGAWYINGNPTVSFQQGHILTAGDVDTIANELDAAGFFNPSGNNPFQFFAGYVAKEDFKKILAAHVGEAWTPELLVKIGGETGTQAVQVGSLNGTVPALQNIANIFDPTKMVARFIHIGAIIAGGLMIAYGVKILVNAAGASEPGGGYAPSGGGGGGGTVVQRYPFIIHEGGTESDEAEGLVDEAPIGTTNKHPLVRKPRASRSKGPIDYPEYVDHSDQNPSTTTAPLRNAE